MQFSLRLLLAVTVWVACGAWYFGYKPRQFVELDSKPTGSISPITCPEFFATPLDPNTRHELNGNTLRTFDQPPCRDLQFRDIDWQRWDLLYISGPGDLIQRGGILFLTDQPTGFNLPKSRDRFLQVGQGRRPWLVPSITIVGLDLLVLALLFAGGLWLWHACHWDPETPGPTLYRSHLLLKSRVRGASG